MKPKTCTITDIKTEDDVWYDEVMKRHTRSLKERRKRGNLAYKIAYKIICFFKGHVWADLPLKLVTRDNETFKIVDNVFAYTGCSIHNVFFITCKRCVKEELRFN